MREIVVPDGRLDTEFSNGAGIYRGRHPVREQRKPGCWGYKSYTANSLRGWDCHSSATRPKAKAKFPKLLISPAMLTRSLSGEALVSRASRASPSLGPIRSESRDDGPPLQRNHQLDS